MNLHRLDNPILVILFPLTPPLLFSPVHGCRIAIATVRKPQFNDAVMTRLTRFPASVLSPFVRDTLFALTAHITIEFHVGGTFAAIGRRGEVKACGFGGFGPGAGRLEGTEGEDAGEEGPAVRDVGDDHGGGGFAGVPIEVDEGAVAGGEVVVAVQDCGENDEAAEAEDTAENDFSIMRVVSVDVWRKKGALGQG